jgi:hypothetical protein
MKIEIFIAVRGGVVQGVRATTVPSPKKHTPANTAPTYECHVVDYDNHECDRGRDGMTEEEFEREILNGRTWAEIEKISVQVW